MINDYTIWVYIEYIHEELCQKGILKKDAVAMIGSDGLVG